MLIHSSAHARAGLIGNPSDGYYGKTISFIVRNFSATVTCYESPNLSIRTSPPDALTFDDPDSLLRTIRLNGYYGGVRLIKATLKVFFEYCKREGLSLGDRTCTLKYHTKIPMQVGLAGSSAIITSVMRALMEFYEVDIPILERPNLILSVETDELNISAGLQDRVIQVYEGAVFMDFDRSLVEAQGHGTYEPLPPGQLPPLFVAYHPKLARGTEKTHNDLETRFKQGDTQVVQAMKTFASLAQDARDYIVEGRGRDIGPLMDENFDLRTHLYDVGRGNHRLVNIGRTYGAHVKFCGSGGAVVGTYDGDPERLEALRDAYDKFGAHLIEPHVVPDTVTTNGQSTAEYFEGDHTRSGDGHAVSSGNQVHAERNAPDRR